MFEMKRNEKSKRRKLEGGKLERSGMQQLEGGMLERSRKRKQAGKSNQMIVKLAMIAIVMMKLGANGFVVRTGHNNFGRRRPETGSDLRRVEFFDGSELNQFKVEIETMKIFGDVENVKNIIVEKESSDEVSGRVKKLSGRQSKANRQAKSLGEVGEIILMPRSEEVPKADRQMRTLVAIGREHAGTATKRKGQMGSHGWVTDFRATEAGSVAVVTGASVARSIWKSGNKKNKMMKAIESMTMQNEKVNHEKTKDLCGIALGISVTQNATESGDCSQERVTGSVEMRKIGIREAEAMLLEKPVSHDQESHPVIFYAQ